MGKSIKFTVKQKTCGTLSDSWNHLQQLPPTLNPRSNDQPENPEPV